MRPGNTVVTFTSGHIKFRQSLLVRAEDAERIITHADLTSEGSALGVLAATTGEVRLLELTGLVDANGVLAEGTRVEISAGVETSPGIVVYSRC